MVVPPDRQRLLAAVERSPQAAAAHDRAGWVGLFATDGRIEDPVGSRPHVGHRQIGRFYDTFIGPRDITFHRDLDVVVGTVVVRDLELEVCMGSAVTMHIPAFLRYDLQQDLREGNGQWRIARLRAYWELPAMMLQFLGTGSRAIRPAVQLSRGLLTNQGLRGTAGFGAGFRRVGARHQKFVEAFLGAVTRGDTTTAGRALSPTATITLGDDQPLGLAGLAERLEGGGWTKTIGAGSTVTVAVNSGRGRAVLFAEVARRADAIDGIGYFPA
ncbi:ketosteroid isomerase family protein [Mycobacterium servetii]|uniref:Ketosteroid isomerase family protein n=1 Tax=Mycobacterium servetii TaxID=3237418 RepID=A0ABV4C4N1_9MYCO